MRQYLFALAALLAVGCGGPPTGPSTVPQAPTQQASAPEPVPPVEQPQPAPAPPVLPVPSPYRADTGWSFWFTAELVPNKFDVEIHGTTLQFGPLTLPILVNGDGTILAKDQTTTVNLRRVSNDRDLWVWSVNSLNGQAAGEMSR